MFLATKRKSCRVNFWSLIYKTDDNVCLFHSTRLQQIATGDYLTRIFSNLVRFGGHDRQLSGGGEGWHGKKGGSMNIETYVTVQFWDILFYWAGMFKIL